MARESFIKKLGKGAVIATALLSSCLPYVPSSNEKSQETKEIQYPLRSYSSEMSFLNPEDYYRVERMQPDLKLPNLEGLVRIEEKSKEKISPQHVPENTPEGVKFLARVLRENEECYCSGSTCTDIASGVLRYSDKRGIDPLVSAAIIVKESNCVADVSSSRMALGPMQTVRQTYFDHCYGAIGKKPFESLKNSSNLGYAINCGIKIFQDKGANNEAINQEGIRGSWPYQNNPAFRRIVDGCIKKFPKYGEYKGIEAALRLYNGAGCDSRTGADKDYVEKVMAKRDRLAKSYATLIASSEY